MSSAYLSLVTEFNADPAVDQVDQSK